MNKEVPKVSSCFNLCTSKKFRSAAVALAGQIRGAINAGLDLLVPFGAMPKGTIKKNKLLREQYKSIRKPAVNKSNNKS